jgi:hypothetical protein
MAKRAMVRQHSGAVSAGISRVLVEGVRLTRRGSGDFFPREGVSQEIRRGKWYRVPRRIQTRRARPYTFR